MKKAVRIIGLVVLGIIVLLTIAIIVQPSSGHVEESIVINAAPPVVFAHVNSLKKMNAWSPWAKMDPEATFVYEGPEEGVGAKMTWSGAKIGKGSQWVESSEVNARVRNGLTFDGYDGTSYAEIVLTPEDNATKVTWTYDGQNAGMSGKAMWLIMKSALSTQFSQGLKDLKTVVESSPAPADVSSDTTRH